MERPVVIEDKLLIWRFKRGDRDALRRIYQKYRTDLLKLAVGLIGDVNTAEDVVHDVFLRLAQTSAKLKVAGNLKSYLATCVANRIRNLRRDRQRHAAVGLDDPDVIATDSPDPARWIVLSEELALLSDALVRIPDEQREVVALHIQGGMKFRQIAALQDVSINTVQGRYRYGLEKLRSLLNHKVKK